MSNARAPTARVKALEQSAKLRHNSPPIAQEMDDGTWMLNHEPYATYDEVRQACQKMQTGFSLLVLRRNGNIETYPDLNEPLTPEPPGKEEFASDLIAKYGFDGYYRIRERRIAQGIAHVYRTDDETIIEYQDGRQERRGKDAEE